MQPLNERSVADPPFRTDGYGVTIVVLAPATNRSGHTSDSKTPEFQSLTSMFCLPTGPLLEVRRTSPARRRFLEVD